MFKNWFLLASVSCGVGFGSTFLISRNLQQSTLAGLGTVPAVAASLTILSRQRREEIERQVTTSRLGLGDAQEQLAKAQLQLKESSCREISEHRQELQTVQQAVSRDREKKVGLERDINSLVLKKQTGESLLVQLDAKVLDKQKQLETTNVKLAQIQAQGQLEIDSGRQSNLQLQSIHEQIRQYSATRQQLQDQITDLDRLLAPKKSLLQDIARQEQSLQQAISALSLQKKDEKVLLDRLVLDISTNHNNLFKLDAEVREKRADLEKIAIDLAQAEVRKQSAIDSAQKSKLTLANIQEQIHQSSTIKEQLETQITDLKNRYQSLKTILYNRKVDLSRIESQISQREEQRNQVSIDIADLDRLLEQKQSLLHEIDLQQQQSLQQEISDLLLQKQDQRILLDRLVVNISAEQNKLIKLDIEIRERQANLDKIAINLVETEARKQSAIDSAQKSELALTNIEEKISERQANSDRIAIGLAEIESKRQSIIDSVNQSESILADIFREISQQSANKEKLETAIFDLQKQRESLQVTIVLPDSTSPAILATSEEWEVFFNNDPNLSILKDIKTHGRISISEATRILGSDRSRRGFANKINEYNQDCNLPFNIKIENFNNTDYYIKISENETITFNSQKPQDVILIDQEEIQRNGLQDRSNNESRAWDYHFQNDPLLPILRCINSYSRVAKSTINGMIRISSLTINFQAELPIYNSNENLPFLITEGISHTGEEFYIKQLKYC